MNRHGSLQGRRRGALLRLHRWLGLILFLPLLSLAVSGTGLAFAREIDRVLRALSLATLLAVLFLIWVGGMVRATGAGMGCPDWTTCFGQVIPPLSEADLPADYRQRWADKGYAETSFNAVKTWTE